MLSFLFSLIETASYPPISNQVNWYSPQQANFHYHANPVSTQQKTNKTFLMSSAKLFPLSSYIPKVRSNDKNRNLGRKVNTYVLTAVHFWRLKTYQHFVLHEIITLIINQSCIKYWKCTLWLVYSEENIQTQNIVNIKIKVEQVYFFGSITSHASESWKT